MSKNRWSQIVTKNQQKEKEVLEETLSNLENADPELCIKLLHFPSVQNFSGFKKKIEKCSEEWMLGFLEQDGLAVLFATLERLSDTVNYPKITLITSMELIHCVGCVKAVMNSRVGLDYVISREDYTRMLSKTLGSGNVMVKKQVFELLAAMCIYSAEGKARAIDAMEHNKQAMSQRYRFSIVINELKSTENIPYQTGLLSFINAAILSTESLHDRMHLRNEFIGLQLLDILSDLRYTESEDLLIQIDVFDERKLDDEEEMVLFTGEEGVNINDHKDVFLAIFNKVCNSPQANHFLTILQCLLQLNPEDHLSDVVWEILDKSVQRMVAIDNEEEGRKFLKPRDTNSDLKRFNKTLCDSCVQTDNSLIESFFIPRKNSLDDSSSSSEIFRASPAVSPPPAYEALLSSPPAATPPPPPPPPPPAPPVPFGSGVSPPPPLPGGVPAPPPPPGGIPPPGGVPPPPPPPGGVPPPPPPPGGVPPPPPPPGGVPPPPPGGAPPPPCIVPTYANPCQAAVVLRRSASVPKPTAKLRKFNWQKIPQGTIRNSSHSVWDSLEECDSGVEPNYNALEELFAQKVISKKAATETKKAAPTEVSLIDSRRAMNIGIFLRQFKKTNEEIINALKEGNADVMTEEKLRNMLKFLPEQSEIDMISAFSGDKSTLANVDRYFLLLSKLPHYKLRIEAGIARVTFEEDMADIVPAIENIKKACNDIRTCRKLEDFLLLILKTGNYMNFGGHSGDAHGFKITSLLKLSDTKANKPRMTLLHCVVMEAESKNPSLLDLSKDMETVLKCKTLSVDQLEADIKRLTAATNKLQKQVENASQEVQDQYAPFFKKASERIAAFDEDLKEIEKLRLDLANYLVEEPSKFKLEECISIFAKFTEQLITAIKDNKERAIMEEKKKKREAMEAERRKKNPGSLKKKEPPPESENIIDNLLSDIRKGFTLKKTRTPSMRRTSSVRRSPSVRTPQSQAPPETITENGETNPNTDVSVTPDSDALKIPASSNDVTAPQTKASEPAEMENPTITEDVKKSDPPAIIVDQNKLPITEPEPVAEEIKEPEPEKAKPANTTIDDSRSLAVTNTEPEVKDLPTDEDADTLISEVPCPPSEDLNTDGIREPITLNADNVAIDPSDDVVNAADATADDVINELMEMANSDENILKDDDKISSPKENAADDVISKSSDVISQNDVKINVNNVVDDMLDLDQYIDGEIIVDKADDVTDPSKPPVSNGHVIKAKEEPLTEDKPVEIPPSDVTADVGTSVDALQDQRTSKDSFADAEEKPSISENGDVANETTSSINGKDDFLIIHDSSSTISAEELSDSNLKTQSVRVLRPSRIPVSPQRKLNPPSVTISHFPSFKSKSGSKSPLFVDRLNSNKNKKGILGSKTNINSPSFTPVPPETKSSKKSGIARFKRNSKKAAPSAKETIVKHRTVEATSSLERKRTKKKSKAKNRLSVQNPLDDSTEFVKPKRSSSIRRTFTWLLRRNRPNPATTV